MRPDKKTDDRIEQLEARVAELEQLLAALATSDTESDDAENWRLDHGLDDTGVEAAMRYQNDLADCIDEGRAIVDAKPKEGE